MLSLTAPSAKNICRKARDKASNAKDLSREARGKAPLGANSEAILTSLEGRAMRRKAKLISKGRAKTVALPCKVTLSGESILASPIAERKAFKAKPRASQPKGVSFQSSRVSVLDRLGPVNTDLRDYLSNKQKLRLEEPVHISSSQCGQAGCQLVTVHSIHYCLGTMPITPLSRQSVFNRLSA